MGLQPMPRHPGIAGDLADTAWEELGPVPCHTSHAGHRWKESWGLRALLRGFPAGPSPVANNRAINSSSSAVGEGSCTSLSLGSIPWQHGQGQAGSTQRHGNWGGMQAGVTKGITFVVIGGFKTTLGIIWGLCIYCHGLSLLCWLKALPGVQLGAGDLTPPMLCLLALLPSLPCRCPGKCLSWQ